MGMCQEMENRSSSAPVPVQQEGVVGPQDSPAVQHRGAQGWPGATKQELMAEELRSGCALAW